MSDMGLQIEMTIRTAWDAVLYREKIYATFYRSLRSKTTWVARSMRRAKLRQGVRIEFSLTVRAKLDKLLAFGTTGSTFEAVRIVTPALISNYCVYSSYVIDQH